MEGIFKAHLLADRLQTEPIATGPATAVHQSEMNATATGSLVLLGPVFQPDLNRPQPQPVACYGTTPKNRSKLLFLEFRRNL